MLLAPHDVHRWAAHLVAARRDRTGCPPITDTASIDLDDAYAIQRELTAARLARGERVVGWKLGYTSLAMREQMGIAQPNFGPLTDAMLLADADTVAPDLLQPRVEPEIALRFALPLAGRVTVEEVLAAVASAHACLEVVDSVYPGYRFRLEDNTADGSSAAQVVLGAELPARARLDEIDVVLRHDGREVGRATGAAASGHPAAGVVWLVERLAERGLALGRGDVVITGGLTRAEPLGPGEVIEAVFGGAVCVSVRR